MACIAATSAPPPREPATNGPPPRPLPVDETGSGSGSTGSSIRICIASWMEGRFGRAAMPVAAVAGGVLGVLGGTVGMLSLGPIGAAVGGAVVGGTAGACRGAALQMAG